jgi:hypothetical protein
MKPEQKILIISALGIVTMAERFTEKACRSIEISNGDARPAAVSYSLCHNLENVFLPHSHEDSHHSEILNFSVPSVTGTNVSASVESFSYHALQQTKRETITSPITAAMLGRVYSISALKVLSEFSPLSITDARRAFLCFQLDALLVKVRVRFKGDIDLTLAADILGFDHPPRFHLT